MVQSIPAPRYRFDPADPRSPTVEQWEQMSPAEREKVLDMLPIEVPWELEPEGDPHFDAKVTTRLTLDDFFARSGRRIYISAELAVYYPGEKRFSPDVLAVLDVEPKTRTKWAVLEEGKGLDLVIEVLYAGHKAKDLEANVERYARLGIREYFIFDRKKLKLRGYRLEEPAARAYKPILPQGGLYASHVLGLDLRLEGERLRFYAGTAPLLEARERIATLASTLDDVVARREEAEARAVAEAERADAEAERADDAERKLAEALGEIERLKRGN
jgi:Uma2 family endonuclease